MKVKYDGLINHAHDELREVLSYLCILLIFQVLRNISLAKHLLVNTYMLIYCPIELVRLCHILITKVC